MSKMRYRVLGSSGMKVSELCLGTMMFGGPTPEAEARRIIDDALDRGVNFIDTADVYAEGRSEGVIGPAIKGKRDRWVLATKLAQSTGPGVTDMGLSRRHMVRAVEASLKRLQTDHIDLYYTHRVDPDTAWEQTIATFGDLIRQGKIREWGLSNVRAWHIPHVCHLCRQLNVPPPVALQPYYNLMNRQPEVELLPAAHAFRLGVVPYSPLARGVLTGKYKVNQKVEAGSRAARQDKRGEARGARQGARDDAGALGYRLGAQ
jgi:aryl-alcohol dehydrogenase-like predicted oxidoreductase